MARPRDVAWGGFALVSGLLGAVAAATLLWLAFVRQEWGALLRLPVAVLFYYWFAMGAWRRTTWGRPADVG